MFHQVTLRVSDRDASERFLRTVLPPLGVGAPSTGGEMVRFGDLGIAPARDDRPCTTGLHVGLVAPSIQAIDAFWNAGIAAGYESDGAPGPRPTYSPDYYGAFLRDPDGNSIEAVRHGALRAGQGLVDHLWVRVASVATSRAFYEQLASQCGLTLRAAEPGLVRFRGPLGGSITLLEGSPRTTGVELALLADGESLAAHHVDPDGHVVDVVTARSSG